MIRPGGGPSSGRLAGLAALLVVLWFAWHTRYVYPLRILVTFLHEISHGLAGVVTGGSIEKITVESNGSGLCYVAGGWRSIIIPAGYLGSMAWGCFILIAACRTRWDRYLSLALGLGLTGMTLLYVRSDFGFISGMILGPALASAGWWLNEELNDLLLMTIGTTSCLYAVFDIQYLVKLGRGYNDATLFSNEIIPLPPVVWAVLWGLAALVCLAVALRVALWERGGPWERN